MRRPLEHVLVSGHRADAERAIASMRHLVEAMAEPGVEWSREAGSWRSPLGAAGGEMVLKRVRSDQFLVASRPDAIAKLVCACFMICPTDLADEGATMARHLLEVMELIARTPWRDAETFAGMDEWILGAVTLADPVPDHVGVVDLATPWSGTKLESGMGEAATMPEDVLARFDARVPPTITIASRFSDGSHRLYVSSSYRWKDPAVLWSPAYDPVRTLRVMAAMHAAGVVDGEHR